MNPKLKTFIDSKYGHLLFLGVALFAGAFAQNLKDQPDFLSALITWNTANLAADLKMAAAFGMTALIAWLKTDPWTVAANKVAAARKVPTVPPMALLLLGGLAMTQLGCPLPAALPADLAADYACVQEGVAAHLSALQIEVKCLPGQLETVLSIITSLLGSPQWRAAHPDLIPVAEGLKVEIQAKIAAGAR